MGDKQEIIITSLKRFKKTVDERGYVYDEKIEVGGDCEGNWV